MSQNRGWFSIERDIFEHWIKPTKPFSKFEAWINLIGMANHAEAKIVIKGQLIQIKRGQQARSMVTLSKDWGWSRDKVKRFCDVLVSDSMIHIETSHLTSVISICNYNEKQANTAADKAANEASNGQQTGSRQVTNNNVNNENNENKVVKKKKYTFSDDDMRCAEYIFKLIKDMDPDHQSPNFDSWANTVRLMVKANELSHKEICEVFKWANNDSFWQTNVLSPSKLRDKFSELRLKMGRSNSSGNVSANNLQLPDREDYGTEIKGSL